MSKGPDVQRGAAGAAGAAGAGGAVSLPPPLITSPISDERDPSFDERDPSFVTNGSPISDERDPKVGWNRVRLLGAAPAAWSLDTLATY